MKNTLFLSLIMLLSFNLFSQNSGMIQYVEVRKLDFEIEAPDGMDISSMLPESTTSYRDLYFNGKRSIYKEGEKKEDNSVEMESEDGGMKIVLKMDNEIDEFYTDIEEGNYLHRTSFMNKEFIINHEADEKPKWKLTGEQIKYLGYVCQKATMTVPGEDDEGDRLITAWFTPQIPAPVGPVFYNQLPGGILMLSEDGDKVEIKATNIELSENYNDLIKEPNKGKRVSESEFDEIVEAKEKEMIEMYGGSGGMIIRGH